MIMYQFIKDLIRLPSAPVTVEKFGQFSLKKLGLKCMEHIVELKEDSHTLLVFIFREFHHIANHIKNLPKKT